MRELRIPNTRSMKKLLVKPVLSVFLAAGLLSSCVSTKKYEAALAENRSLVVLQDELNRQKAELENERAALQGDKERLAQEKADLARSEERRVGKECRSRQGPYHVRENWSHG